MTHQAGENCHDGQGWKGGTEDEVSWITHAHDGSYKEWFVTDFTDHDGRKTKKEWAMEFWLSDLFLILIFIFMVMMVVVVVALEKRPKIGIEEWGWGLNQIGWLRLFFESKWPDQEEG